MNKLRIIFSFIIVLLFSQTVLSSNCVLDSIGNKKIEYNEFGKPNLIYYHTDYFEHSGKVIVYNKLNYDNNNYLSSISSYIIDSNGDTITKPQIIKRFIFTNNKLSKITQSNVIYDDIIWENDKIVELKYYYLTGGIIDLTQTRILKFTYENDNIKNFIYKELSGLLFNDSEYSHDESINPFYMSELALNDGNMLNYSCKNNWLNSNRTGDFSTNSTRTISYNQSNYPTSIITDYGNGNKSEETYSYKISSAVIEKIENEKINISQSSSHSFIKVDSEFQIEINSLKIIDINGTVVRESYSSNQINIEGVKTGIYFIEVGLNKQRTTTKIIIYGS